MVKNNMKKIMKAGADGSELNIAFFKKENLDEYLYTKKKNIIEYQDVWTLDDLNP